MNARALRIVDDDYLAELAGQESPTGAEPGAPVTVPSRAGSTETFAAPCPQAETLVGGGWDAPRNLPRNPMRFFFPADGLSDREWLRMWGIEPAACGLFMAFKAVNGQGHSRRGARYWPGHVTVDRDWERRTDTAGLYLCPTVRAALTYGVNLGPDVTILAVATPSVGFKAHLGMRDKIRVRWCWTIGRA